MVGVGGMEWYMVRLSGENIEGPNRRVQLRKTLENSVRGG